MPKQDDDGSEYTDNTCKVSNYWMKCESKQAKQTNKHKQESFSKKQMVLCSIVVSQVRLKVVFFAPLLYSLLDLMKCHNAHVTFADSSC